MKKDELQKIKTKSKEELTKEVKELQDLLWKMKGDLRSGKVKNVSTVHETKKGIARRLTYLHQK